MILDPSTLLVGIVSAVVPSSFGWLLMRAVQSVDRSLEVLTEKVDQLGKGHTELLVEVAVLRSRVTNLEHRSGGGSDGESHTDSRFREDS
jgi:hypothetical protein